MKKILIIVFVLIVLGIAGYFINQYFTNPRTISSTSEPITSCIDPDGNNVFEKSTTAYQYTGDNSDRTVEVSCDYSKSRAGILSETYCSSGYLVTNKVSCGTGSVCRSGRCIEGSKNLSICNDNDGGISPKARGEINTGVTAQDMCWTSTNKTNPRDDGGFVPECKGPNCYVYEYFCNNDDRDYQIIPSPNGCLNGAEI
jgi:hypothetical protein